ncbi:hypothetical protein HHK36_007242 [Tetracentron sinense]|uniref:Uncharacterized protein n=1 Tax=Tetracentron sinense TaxID=13715 RepID=A0A834ZMA0_TETSI|nr:hypothetical protein HHK36_007242 [Tetracentron sinense]
MRFLQDLVPGCNKTETLDLEQMSFVPLVFGAISGQAISLAIAQDGASEGFRIVIVRSLSIIFPRHVCPGKE